MVPVAGPRLSAAMIPDASKHDRSAAGLRAQAGLRTGGPPPLGRRRPTVTVGGSLLALAGTTAIRSLLSPAFLAVAGLAAVATLVLYAEHPKVSRRTVVSLVPWMVAGGALSVLGAQAAYPARIQPAVTGTGAYLTTYIVVCLAWFAILQFARGNRRSGQLPTYLGAMGTGAATIVVGTLLLRADAVGESQLFWLAIAPIAAAAVAGIVLLLLGLWYPEAAAYTGMAGGLVVFGHVLAAIGTAVAVVAHGAHSTLSWAVLNLVVAGGAAALTGLDQQLVWAWGFVWTKLLLATAAIIVLTAYTRRHPDRGNVLLGLVAAVGVIGGVTALLSMVVA